jgi:integrase
MPRVTLTPREVDRLTAEAGRAQTIYMDDHPDAPRGFALRCWATGVKAFYLLRTVRGAGRRTWVWVAPGQGAGLKRARQAAEILAGDIADGVDPNVRAKEARRRARVEQLQKATEADEWTVRAMLEAYVSAKIDQGISAATESGYRGDIALMFGDGVPIATVRARNVVRDDVRRLLRGVERQRTPNMAGRALALLRAAFRWALDEEARTVLQDGTATVRPRVDRDPTRRIEVEFPAVREAMRRARKRVLSDEEIVVFWRGIGAAQPGLLRAVGEPPYRPYPLPWARWSIMPKLILLSGTRRGETHAARWSNISLGGPEPSWFLPSKDRKAVRTTRRELTIPLAPLSVQLFLELKGDRPPRNPHLYTGRVFTQSIGWAGSFVHDATGLRDITLHDLRRTCANGVKRLGAPPHVVSMILGHRREVGALPSDEPYTPDRRLTEHREWLRRWAEHVERLVGLRGPADVVPIKA